MWDTVYMPVATAWMRAADEEHSTLEQQSPRRVQIAAATLSGNILGKLFTPIVPLFTKQQNW